MSIYIHSIGVLGMLILAVNFILEASEKLDKKHHWYIINNMLASICLCVYAIISEFMVFVILNAMLVLISIYELVRKFMSHKD